MRIDVLHLEVFQAVARLGSMTKAAVALGLAQPTISARVSELETDVGAALFTRTPRGVKLTAAGRRFLGYAERCLAVYGEGRRAARSETERRELRLAAPASLAESLFPLLAPRLVWAGFDVALSTNHSPQVIEMLLDGRIDAGVCALRPAPAGVVARALPTIPIVCVVRPDHRLASSAPGACGLAGLAGGLAIFEWSGQVADLLERLQIVAGREALSGYVKVSPAGVARRLVLERGVAAFLPLLTVQPDLDRRELVRLEPEGTTDYGWELMFVHRDQDDAAHDALREELSTILNAAEDWPPPTRR
jgi:LysR family transcriptional regulator, pca operon transcriptional activator